MSKNYQYPLRSPLDIPDQTKGIDKNFKNEFVVYPNTSEELEEASARLASGASDKDELKIWLEIVIGEDWKDYVSERKRKRTKKQKKE